MQSLHLRKIFKIGGAGVKPPHHSGSNEIPIIKNSDHFFPMFEEPIVNPYGNPYGLSYGYLRRKSVRIFFSNKFFEVLNLHV